MGNSIDLTGKKFGKLTAIKTERMKGGYNGWVCLCDCGKYNKKPISAYSLRSGKRTNCGCEGRSRESNWKHGMYNEKIYKVWSSMKSRCSNNTDRYFMNYGGRGIAVCDDWLTFERFYEWAIFNGYKEGLTIERIDVDGNYCPENCKWIPKGDQSSNTRRNVFVTHNGMTKNLKDWSVYLNVPYSMLLGRLKRGWSGERALTEPIIERRFVRGKRLEYNGIVKTGSEWARFLCIPANTIYKMLKKHGAIGEVIKKCANTEITGIITTVEAE